MWYSDGHVEAVLDELCQRHFRSASDGIAAVAEATKIINAALLMHDTRPTPTATLPERFEDWVDRLRDLAATVARQFSAVTYSISVGLPAGVAVSLTWPRDD